MIGFGRLPARIVSDNNSVTVIKGARRPTVGAVEDERCGRPLDDDSTSEDATSHGHNTDSEATFSVSSTGAEEDDEEDEYGEASEADLTLGGAVRGDRQIPDEFWEANCPFPEHLHEEDQRIRVSFQCWSLLSGDPEFYLFLRFLIIF